jgi:hypothetical protein
VGCELQKAGTRSVREIDKGSFFLSYMPVDGLPNPTLFDNANPTVFDHLDPTQFDRVHPTRI